MSTIKTMGSASIDDSLGYGIHGPGESVKAPSAEAVERAGDHGILIRMAGAENPTVQQFVERGEALARANGRTKEAQLYIQAFRPEEFDPKNTADVARGAQVAQRTMEAMQSADHVIVPHTDRGHLHFHCYVLNHDNLTGKALSQNTRWDRGVQRVNDMVMEREGLLVEKDPHREHPGWALRREEFAVGGFERTLGDKIAAAQRDTRSVDFASYRQTLSEQSVKLRQTKRTAKDGTERIGWHYAMRYEGREIRKAATKLTPEFAEAQTRERFVLNARQQILDDQLPGYEAQQVAAAESRLDRNEVNASVVAEEHLRERERRRQQQVPQRPAAEWPTFRSRPQPKQDAEPEHVTEPAQLSAYQQALKTHRIDPQPKPQNARQKAMQALAGKVPQTEDERRQAARDEFRAATRKSREKTQDRGMSL
ncbi:relaxase/mobilization nuclease domain-containing protein [Nesterenkonia populi]|uniref:relaxase/mobilization nuclease domain-containing protein n=1 Tax=Nesterenkonia populi TaxID=1591087 RepID=UPI0011BF0B50|nr:relaxase/mobilization nuclease domain-containing protein [Nesterenkonia populi]